MAQVQESVDVNVPVRTAYRTTVSLVAGNLQRAGLIHYRRGHIKITDVEALKDSSCECYEKVRNDYQLLQAAR